MKAKRERKKQSDDGEKCHIINPLSTMGSNGPQNKI